MSEVSPETAEPAMSLGSPLVAAGSADELIGSVLGDCGLKTGMHFVLLGRNSREHRLD
jgi:hypothetical protein